MVSKVATADRQPRRLSNTRTSKWATVLLPALVGMDAVLSLLLQLSGALLQPKVSAMAMVVTKVKLPQRFPNNHVGLTTSMCMLLVLRGRQRETGI